MTGKNEERNNNKSFTNTPKAQSPSLVLNATPPASAFQNNITAFHNMMNKNIHEEESENDGDSVVVDDEKVKNKIASAMEEQDQVEEAHIEAEFEKANSMMEFDNSWSDIDGLNFFQKDKDEQHDEYDGQQESPTVKQTISSTEGRGYNKEEEAEEEESATNINVQIDNSNTSQSDGQKPTNLPEKANNQEHENKDALKSEEDEPNMLLEIVEEHIAEKTELEHHEDDEKLKNDSNLTEKLSSSEIKDEPNNYVYEELSNKRSVDDKDEDEIVSSSPEIQKTVMNENINEEINDQESVETKTCIDSLNTNAQALQKRDMHEDESSQITESTTSPSSITEEKQDTSEKLINLKTDSNAEAEENLKEQTETKVEETEKEVISDEDLCENSKESSKFQVGDHIYFTEFLKLPYRHAIVLDVFTTNNGEEKEESMVIADIINVTKSHQEGEDSNDARKKSFRIPCLMNFSKNNSQRILQDVYLEDRNTKDGKLMIEDFTDQDQDSNNKKTVCRCIPQSEYKSWKKVVYGATLKERYLSLHLPGTVTSVKSSHPLLVISRAKYLMANPQLLPPHNSLTSNCECMAVWCKTGTWLTVRTATMLSLLATSPIKSACSAGAFVGSQTVAVSTPAPGVLGWMGFHTTTQMSLAAAQPLLLPAIAVSGALLASGPFVMLHRYKQKWKEVEQKLNALFWKEFWGGVDEETFQKICSFLFVNEEEIQVDQESQGNVNEEEQEPGKSDTTSSIPNAEKEEEIQNESSSSTSHDDVDDRSENKSKKIQHGENEQATVDLD